MPLHLLLHEATPEPEAVYTAMNISIEDTLVCASTERSSERGCPNGTDQLLPAAAGRTFARRALAVVWAGRVLLDKSTDLVEDGWP